MYIYNFHTYKSKMFKKKYSGVSILILYIINFPGNLKNSERQCTFTAVFTSAWFSKIQETGTDVC